MVLAAALLGLAGTPTADGASNGVGGESCHGPPAPELQAAPGEWPLPNIDHRSSRRQATSRIDASSVAELESAWRYEVPGTALFGNLTTNPLVIDGAVYVGALDGSVHVVGLEDGAERWSVRRSLNQFGPSGVAVGWGKVFGISGSAVAVAHDAADGSVLWTRSLGQAPGNQIDVQPTVVGGCVLLATQGLLPGSRGTLWALHQATGEVAWSFHTVPDDFWGNPQVNGGGGSWYPPTVDVERGRVYWGTSNPWPAPGAPGWPAGSSRPGDNLYTNTALAFDVATGSLEWHRQAIPHDLFDRDMVLTMLVETAGGDVVIHTGKAGVVFGLDPDSGALLWETSVGMHLNDDVTSWTGPLTVMPGVLGGVQTPPASADGIVYLAVMNAPTTYASPEQSFSLTVALGSHPSDLVAIDAATGTILWEAPIPGDALGAVTVVNDLLFTSTFEGLLLAFDRATGVEVWRHQADGFVNGWPAVLEDTIVWPISGTSPSELIALRLPPEPDPPDPPDPPSPPDPPDASDAPAAIDRVDQSEAVAMPALEPAPTTPAADPARPIVGRPSFTG